MGHQYAGDATAFPSDFTIPDDLDDDAAATFDVAFEALGDRTANIDARIKARRDLMVNASGTWTCPAGVFRVKCRGWGGSGGGGCGGDGSLTASVGASSGAGGGGPHERFQDIDVTPGLVYTYVRGAGGAGSTSSASFGRGNDGGDTTVSSPTPTVLATFRGAQGGGNGVPGVSTTLGAISIGGSPCRIGHTDTGLAFAQFVLGSATPIMRSAASTGGDGLTQTAINVMSLTNEGQAGGGNSAFDGGAAGVAGVVSGTRFGGGGGGGGGAGPGGAGGAGGTGGAGGATTAGAATVGADAPTGGGGGGGGGAGGGAGTTSTVGKAGGVGGYGHLEFIYSGPQAVFT